MNKTLINNLKYTLDTTVENSFDVNNAHIYLHQYSKEQNETTLIYIERIKSMDLSDNYIKYPFLFGYDTIINKMHNYHILVPEIIRYEITSLDDLFMFYEILTFINTMMYDEYDQIRKKFQSSLITFAKRETSAMLDLLIKMAVCKKFVNVSLLNMLSNSSSEDKELSLLNSQLDIELLSRGMYDICALDSIEYLGKN